MKKVTGRVLSVSSINDEQQLALRLAIATSYAVTLYQNSERTEHSFIVDEEYLGGVLINILKAVQKGAAKETQAHLLTLEGLGLNEEENQKFWLDFLMQNFSGQVIHDKRAFCNLPSILADIKSTEPVGESVLWICLGRDMTKLIFSMGTDDVRYGHLILRALEQDHKLGPEISAKVGIERGQVIIKIEMPKEEVLIKRCSDLIKREAKRFSISVQGGSE
ncbi:hypothetical protein GGQ84_000286 [Desulfitispora alkaliphila]|uniref:hypothetical protein n=1 Tax=Desulfitispora alkaliphila TaxID=622674 RepID=UPI003D1A7676